MTITYRLATGADAAVLASLRQEFLTEPEDAPTPGPEFPGLLRAYFARAVPAGEFTAWLAEEAWQVVATSGLVYRSLPPSIRNPTGREAYIMNMYTRPAWRGRGIARELLARLLGTVRATGCRKACLHAMPLARPIYERAGFEACDDEMRLMLG